MTAATRRLAAILAADVAGYSRLMGADEEGTLAAVKETRRQLWDPKTEEHHGRIVKTTGDGLLIEFASVVDAVRCAVELQQTMAARNATVPSDRRIAFRIGINLGDVILDEGDIYGDGVNIAARLEALAEPGGICVSRVVRDQVRDRIDVSFEDAGDRRVKNIARPVRVYRIPVAGGAAATPTEPAASEARSKEDLNAGPADQFVGRQRELETLHGALDSAANGHGRIVMLAGEPGIGKTRTAQELAVHAAASGTAVFWGRCPEESGAPPYWPWVQIIRASLQEAAADLLGELGPAAGDITDIVPEMRERLPGLARSDPLSDPAAARFRMFDSIRQFLVGLGRRQALLLILDDLHWADAPSLRLLEFLGPELAGSRILLVGTYRATELSRRHPLSNTLGALARASHFARINLAGLNAEEVQVFIAGAGPSLPAAMTKTLHEQSEGNPLFLREIVRFIEQRAALASGPDGPGAVSTSPVRIPEGVTEVIGRRLNLLSAGCNETLALAAVIGRDFAWEVLQRAAAPLGDEMLLEALDEAVAARIVEETAPRRYRFAHNLIRVTLYDELRIATRRQFHRAAGNAIETVYRADLDPHLPELTRHFQAAGGDADVGRAIDYAVRAGHRADALLAFEDAVQFFRAALDAMEQRSEQDEVLRCRLLFLLGEAQNKAADPQGAMRTLLSAADIASVLGKHELFARAALAYEQATWNYGGSNEQANREQAAELGGARVSTPPAYLLERALQQLSEAQSTLRAQLTAGLARALWHAGAAAEARARGAQAVAMARQLDDPGSLAVYLVYLINALWATDHSEELIGYVTEMIAAAEQARDMEVVGMGYGWRLGMHLEFGNLRAAEADLAAFTSMAAQFRQPGVTGAIVTAHFMLALMRGELAEAERRIAELTKTQRRFATTSEGQLSVMIFSLRREQGRLSEVRPALSMFLQQRAAAAAWLPGLAVIHAELGQLDEARLVFERLAADDFASIAPDGRWHFCMGYLSEVCATLGDAARAATLYRMLEPYTGRNLVLGGSMVCCGSADRYLGLLAATTSHWADAARHFEQARVMNQAIEAHVPLAHTRHDYAAMLLARDAPGDREHATALLRLSLESARKIGMRALEERTVSLLAGLAPILVDTKSAGDGLTSREADVLRLIAIGRSNADIAMVLEISLNTVATHVRNILAKTGCANRTEAAAYAIRNGLAAVIQ